MIILHNSSIEKWTCTLTALCLKDIKSSITSKEMTWRYLEDGGKNWVRIITDRHKWRNMEEVHIREWMRTGWWEEEEEEDPNFKNQSRKSRIHTLRRLQIFPDYGRWYVFMITCLSRITNETQNNTNGTEEHLRYGMRITIITARFNFRTI